jgi:uncharacterized Zn finger protein
MSSFSRDPDHMTAKPRRVRGGVRLAAKTLPVEAGNWAASRWLDTLSRCCSDTAVREGFEYARAGQTRTLAVEPGRIAAAVQGRAIRAYRVVLHVTPFTSEQWDAAVRAIADQAIFASRLLNGDLPSEIESIFEPLGLKLFPSGPEDMTVSCAATNEVPWCKHSACVGLLMAEALSAKPGLILALRGMPAEELIECIRDLRSAAVEATAAHAVTPHASDLDEAEAAPLEAHLEDFWDAGPELSQIETPIRPPDVSHPLLRRLGPSPFPEGKFPLVGLLATCYDVLSKEAVEGGAGAEVSSGLDQDPL